MSREFDLKLPVNVLVVLCLLMHAGTHALTLNSRSDPFPVFTTLDPTLFLNLYEPLNVKEIPTDREKREWFQVSVSPFGQNANSARDNNETVVLALGNIISGKWDMIAMLFGPTPAGQTFPPVVVNAQTTLFPMVPIGTPIDEPTAIDPNQNFGFFDIPLQYRKRGLRFDFGFQVLNDVGVTLKVGAADISQTPQFVNLTCGAFAECDTTKPFTDPDDPALTTDNVNETLMDPCIFTKVTEALDIDVSCFRKFSVEDVQAGIDWCHAY